MDTRLTVTRVLVLVTTLAGCAGLTPPQETGWTAFHDCRAVAPSAVLEDLLVGGRVAYITREGVEFSSMKTCMEARGYACDLGVTIGARPTTHCYPRTGRS